MLTSKENNKTLENSNNKLLEINHDGCILASCLIPPLSKITKSENKSQFTLAKILTQLESMTCYYIE